MSKKGPRHCRRLQEQAPPSGQKPSGHLAARDRAARAEELGSSQGQCPALCPRREPREWSAWYLRGQLATRERTTGAPRGGRCTGPIGPRGAPGRTCGGRGRAFKGRDLETPPQI
jgi:hypothetical protein